MYQRKPKFRVWDVDNKVLCTDITSESFELFYQMKTLGLNMNELITNDRYIIDEYTNVSDCNCVCIFENDILSVIDHDQETECVGIVKMIPALGPFFDLMVIDTSLKLGLSTYSDNSNALIDDNLEIKIIGNYHQNPDLLK